VATPPTDQFEARGWLQAALGPGNYDPPCPQSLLQYGVACAQGDADGDGLKELAYLVPVKLPSTRLPFPATVFVRRGHSQKLDELALTVAADASPIGISVFTLADRTGDGKGDLSYLQNICTATGCRTIPVVYTWDGNSWRDAGPGEEPIGNVDLAKWEGEGAGSKLVMHGGKLPASAPAEAGPTRAATSTFAFNGTRYVLESAVADEPEYLYHAILDAEAVFQSDKRAAIEAFEKVIASTHLLDWRPPGAPAKDRRPALVGLAHFRVALAHAVLQSDEATLTRALDAVVVHGVSSEEPLFVRVTEEFRRGYAERESVAGGCAAVNDYVNKVTPGTDTRAYIEQAFNYGYENPRGSSWMDDICPF